MSLRKKLTELLSLLKLRSPSPQKVGEKKIHKRNAKRGQEVLSLTRSEERGRSISQGTRKKGKEGGGRKGYKRSISLQGETRNRFLFISESCKAPQRWKSREKSFQKKGR